jgi:hypothetical protein
MPILQVMNFWLLEKPQNIQIEQNNIDTQNDDDTFNINKFKDLLLFLSEKLNFYLPVLT